VAGTYAALNSTIDHDDRKPPERWLSDQLRYARLEAEKLAGWSARTVSREGEALRPRATDQNFGNRSGGLGEESTELRLQDRIRQRIIFAPVLVFLYALFWKRLILDGWPGWYYVLQRTYAELLLSLLLLEKGLANMKLPNSSNKTKD
jgi:hypothetical protein